MSEGFNKSSNAAPSSLTSKISPQLRPQVLMMVRALLAAPQRNRILFLGIALVAIIGATAFAQIKLNAWNQPFFDALSRESLGEFFAQLSVFTFIAGGLLILKVAETWFSQTMKVKLREGLVLNLFDEWLKPGRPFRLTNAADWRATLQRIATFREAMIAVDRVGENERQIEFADSSEDKIVLENLEVATQTGCAKLDQSEVEIGQGERVVIAGESGAGKTILFHTIAGLWRWGTGRVKLPSGHRVMFMPRQPYVPLGSLRAALAYPSAESYQKDEELVAALGATGLERLASSIDQSARWDKHLSFDEQQLLVFTRMLLHKPHCVVIDEALDTLDDGVRKSIMSLFNDKLKDTTLINIGRLDKESRFFKRVLHLVKEPSGRCFNPDITTPSFGRVAEAMDNSPG